jgi:peptidoglycan/LPS O-acetylase OafA/YrhL
LPRRPAFFTRSASIGYVAFWVATGWTSLHEFWPLVLLGDGSYSFYLLHSNFLRMPLWKLLASPMVPIAVSVAVYKWIESPAQRKWIRKNKRELKAAPAIAAMA